MDFDAVNVVNTALKSVYLSFTKSKLSTIDCIIYYLPVRHHCCQLVAFLMELCQIVSRIL